MNVNKFIMRNVDQIIGRAELIKKLKGKKKLRVKYGVDVTAPTLHFGHAVNLWKMRELQDGGHKIIFLIGDFTTTIGDPTGKSKTRPTISDAEIKKNVKLFVDQAKQILRFDKPSLLEVRHNSEWYDKMSLKKFTQLLSLITHARLIERDMFEKRILDHKDIYMHELIYPILQGWDSVELESDLTIIGSDQLFNELLGRFYQQKFNQDPQSIITTTITAGIDGGEKQSKSIGNYIGLAHSAIEKYGRIMSIPDELIISYFRTYTDLDDNIVEQIENNLVAGDNPRDTKASLARHMLSRYYSSDEINNTEQQWNKQFRDKELPDNIEEIKFPAHKRPILVDILESHFGLSRSQIRRVLEQKGVKVDGQTVEQADFSSYHNGSVIQLGKRRLVKIKLS